MPININEVEEKSTAKKVVGTQVKQEIYERLQKEAENDFMSISDVLRKIIYIYFREKDRKEENK